jgi:indole-3-glycerol phosphate synthase
MSEPVATVLERILAQTRQELERRKRERPLRGLGAVEVGRRPEERRFHDAVSAPGIGVIAEFKRRSPSAGVLREQPDLSQIVRAYEQGGAIAASILTEGPNFDGALEDLTTAAAACGLPLLRKDFIVDPYQLHEALIAGAAAVLLIVAALEDEQLAHLYQTARGMGLDVLVEIHDRFELQRALELGADIVGVNNRDLRDFSVDVERTEQLLDEVPAGVLVVSESGIGTSEQLARLQDRGVQAVLVGESLMRAADPAAALRELTSFRHSSGDI